MLPRRIPKKPKADGRWKSTRHRDHVRGFACCMCGSTAGVQVAHVRFGSNAGIGRKPDDWRTVPLCGPCHTGDQHTKLGEHAFWALYEQRHGQTVEQLINELCECSPVARQIREVRCAA